MRLPLSRQLPTGPAAAALLSVGLGLLALGMTHIFSEVSVSFKNVMQALGQLWIPGATGIGPYSGKETVALLVWLLGWGTLHLMWRKREVNIIVVGAATLALIGLATTIVWPPIAELMVHH